MPEALPSFGKPSWVSWWQEGGQGILAIDLPEATHLFVFHSMISFSKWLFKSKPCSVPRKQGQRGLSPRSHSRAAKPGRLTLPPPPSATRLMASPKALGVH